MAPHLADKSNRTTRALDNLFSGSCTDTSGKGLLDFLAADPSALDEVLGLFGYGLHRLDQPATGAAVNDASLVADAMALVAQHADAMRDGTRDHKETLAIADKARPVVQGYTSIIAQADRLRGIRRAA